MSDIRDEGYGTDTTTLQTNYNVPCVHKERLVNELQEQYPILFCLCQTG
jgi:hypothetical protein